jgi:hypothetical protein
MSRHHLPPWRKALISITVAGLLLLVLEVGARVLLPPAGRRTLAVGDSCTFGIGVDGALTWPARKQISEPCAPDVLHQIEVAALGRERSVPAVDPVATVIAAREPLFVDHVRANPAGCQIVAATVAYAPEASGLPGEERRLTEDPEGTGRGAPRLGR